MNILRLLKREFWQSLHDPRRIGFLFAAGVAYLIVFGMLYYPNLVKNIPAVIYDEDNSALSRELIKDFEASDSYSITAYVSSQEEMQQALRDKTALVAIGIPKDFARHVKTGSHSTVLYMVNGANIIVTNVTSSAAQDIVNSFSTKVAAERAALRLGADKEAMAKHIAPVTVNYRVLDNPTQGYVKFFLLGLACVAFQQGIFFAVGASISYETEHPDEAAVAPAWQLVLAKLLFYWSQAVIAWLIIVALIEAVVGLPLPAPLWQLMSLSLLFIAAAMGFGMFVASCFQNEMQFLRAIIMYPVAAFILSGYTWPLDSLPPVLQDIAHLFPLTWFSNNVRQLFLAGHTPGLSTSLTALAVMAASYLVIAILLCRWRWCRS